MGAMSFLFRSRMVPSNALGGLICLLAANTAHTESIVSRSFDHQTGEPSRITLLLDSRVPKLPSHEVQDRLSGGNSLDRSILLSFSIAKPATAPSVQEIECSDSFDFGVIGEDNRLVVMETSKFPASAVVQLLFDSGLGSKPQICSGALVSPNSVLTAAHCLHSESTWFSNYTVVPARNGMISNYEACQGTKSFVLEDWITSGGEPQYDFGVLTLNCEAGLHSGYLGIEAASSDRIAESVTFYGYPGCEGRQFKASDAIREITDLEFSHEADTSGGMSGSPALSESGVIFGLHTRTTIARSSPPDRPVYLRNHGTIFTGKRLQAIEAWILGRN